MDVTPIMNMFIILIPFLVSMAVFSQLSVLRFSLPADGGTGRVKDVKELPLTVAMTADELAITRGEEILVVLPRIDGVYDYESLSASLSSLGAGLEDGQNIVIAVDDDVRFEDVVGCMDHCRDSGFPKIGLAAGNNLDRAANAGGSDADN